MALMYSRIGDSASYVQQQYGVATRGPAFFPEVFGAAFDRFQATFRTGAVRNRQWNYLQADLGRFEEITGRDINREDAILNNPQEYWRHPEAVFLAQLQQEVALLPSEQQALFDFDYEGRAAVELREVVATYEETSAAATGGGKFGGVLGALAGVAWDPTLLVASVLGGIALIPRGVTLGKGIMLETGLGSAVELLATPGIMEQEQLAGQEYTWSDAVLNVALAGVLSGGMFAGIRGISTGVNHIRGTTPEVRAFVDILNYRINEGLAWPTTRASRSADALHYFDTMDTAMENLIQGRMIEPLRYEVGTVDFTVVAQRVIQQVNEVAKAIDDPEIRAEFVTHQRESLEAVNNETLEIERRVLAEVESPEAQAAAMGLIDADTRAIQSGQRVRELEALVESVAEFDVDVSLLAKYVTDPAAARRMQVVGTGMRREDLTDRQLRAYATEREKLIEANLREIQEGIDRELDVAYRTQFEAQGRKSNALNIFRETPEAQRLMRREGRGVLNRTTSKMQKVRGGEGVTVSPDTAIDATPFRVAVDNAAVKMQEAVEPARVAEVDLMRKTSLREQLKAALDPEMETLGKRIEVMWRQGMNMEAIVRALDDVDPEIARQAVDLVKNGLVHRKFRITDPDGTSREWSAPELAREFDEQDAALREFDSCRGATSGNASE